MNTKPTYQELENKIKELEINQSFKKTENEKKYANVFNNSPIGIIIFDTTGNALEVNHKIVEILGSPSIEYTKKINILEFNPLKDIGFADSFKECLESHNVTVLEDEYISENNKETYLQCIFSPIINENDTVIKIQCVFIDFTKQKKAEQDLKTRNNELIATEEELRQNNEELNTANKRIEESNFRFQQLSNLTFEGILIHEQGKVVEINQSFATMIGYEYEELIEKNIIKLFVIDDNSSLSFCNTLINK